MNVKVSPSGLQDAVMELDKPNSIILGRSYSSIQNLTQKGKKERDLVMKYAPAAIKPLLYTYHEIDTLWNMENPLGCSIENGMSLMFCIIS